MISKKVLFFLFSSFLFSSSIFACEKHWIKNNFGRGEIIEMDNNTLWKIDPVERVDTMVWLAATEVLLCDGHKIINTQNGRSVEGMLIR